MQIETLERRYQRVNNIRYPKPGRPLGKTLSDQTKAQIMLEKNLQLSTHPSIAAKYDVSRSTVTRMTEDSLSEEGKKHLKTFTDKLSDIREETSDLILEKIRDKSIKDGVLPSLLNIANQNYRLETDQSTQNIKTESKSITLVANLNKLGYSNEQAQILIEEHQDIVKQILGE